MNFRTILFLIILLTGEVCGAQSNQPVNQTDKDGRKQGHWIKKYPSGTILYDGYFRDDKPDGEFKRYYDDGGIMSVMVFSQNGNVANASLFYQNGFPASSGKYVSQLKEGAWKFYSPTVRGLVVSTDEYTKDKRNGLSVQFYPDSAVAEKASYKNDRREGPWLKYYPDGTVSFSANCTNGRLNGSFEGFFENGKPEIKGSYKDDLKDGLWTIYSDDGRERFKIKYTLGIPENRDLDIYETNYLDSLEKNKVTIPDPEKTGQPW